MENDYDYVVSERVAEKLFEQYTGTIDSRKMTCVFYSDYVHWFSDTVIADNCVADLLIEQHIDKLRDDLGDWFTKHTSLHVEKD